MKLRFLFIAIASAILFAACEKESPSSLANIQLDKTFLSIPASGGSTSLKVTANEAWTLSKDIKVGKENEYAPKWLTVSTVSGGVGETTVTFTAEAVDGGREQEFHIECGKVIQYFIVRQGVLTPTEATCEEIMQAPDGKSFRVTGTITSWASNAEKYGNMWISDGTGTIQIYGMADKDGKLANNPIASWGLDIGDIITVDGPKSTYGETIELVDVTVVKVVKSLLKLDNNSFDLQKEGGELTIKAAYKGNGVFVTPIDEWISLDSMEYKEGTPSKLEPHPADTAIIKLTVAPNTDVRPRTGTLSINSSSSDGSKVSSTTMLVTVKQGANAPDLSSIADGIKAGYAHVKGHVMAICNRGYILADQTGAFLAYYGSAFKPENYTIGDEIEIVDQFAHYNFGLQMSCDGKPDGFTYEEKISKGNGTVTYPTPKILDKDALAAYVDFIKGKTSSVENCIPVEYVQVTGVPRKSGNYTNIYIGDYTDADISAYQLPASFDLASMLDKVVTIRGYAQSISGGKHLNIVFTELIEGGEVPPATEETPALFLNEFDTKAKKMEIYNSTDKEVDIAGWLLVKDGGAEEKDIYTIPASLEASKVPAKGYAVFTCKQSDVANGPLFGLSGTKGFKIELKKGDTVVDVADNLTTITEIPDGKSWGRETDGAEKFVIFDTPTIGAANTGAPEQPVPATIAEIIAAMPESATGSDTAVSFDANLTAPAVVSYINGKNAYIQDETGAILLYLENHGLIAGDTVKGKLHITAYWFRGIPEMTAIGSEFEKASGAAPEPKAISLADLIANYDANLLRLVKLVGVTVTDGIADGDRNGKVAQGSDEVDVYAQLNNKGLVLNKDDKGDLVTIPGKYNEKKQIYLWENDWFTKQEEPAASGIKIDGDMSDWANVMSTSNPNENPAYAEFKVASDDANIYFYARRTAVKFNDIWNAGGYLYFAFDTDNDPATGSGEIWGNGPYETIFVIWPFAGSANAPAFADKPLGESMVKPNGSLTNYAANGTFNAETGVELEFSIPRADLPGIPAGKEITIYSWGNKSGENMKDAPRVMAL